MGEMMMGGILFDRPIEEFNNVEVEQFTGIKDKNGREIYEGDVLADGFDNKAIVVFKIHSFQVDGKFISGDFNSSWVVIGNIHENGDLLK
jgi:YopX protein